ncbi:MAG: hypothetical protein CMP67_06625 [Flavobacteriales bacterium]|nr:hypothetical protein [Flavobacteriales bacterium]
MKKILLVLMLFIATNSFAILTTNPDSIRGSLRPERLCYDVTSYDLSINIDPEKKMISGQNDIYFTVLENSKTIQIDLFRHFTVESIYLYAPIDSSGVEEEFPVEFKKIEDALFISFLDTIREGLSYRLKIAYSGYPNVAKKAPWDGGFVWDKDSMDRHFCGVACEGWGASSWWPCKDHLYDEPDSMKLTFFVPEGYQCISNGQLTDASQIKLNNKTYEKYSWKVTYPINTYNVSFYLGSYEKIQGWYVSGNDSLKTEFYALDYNVDKAKSQFQQVNPMLKIYEDLFGKYPFWNDGFKLVEAPYLGMEHQSAIAYGNQYKKGYLGYHPEGIEFDYIIIHESGHEYWGNSVSMEDLADMWIHEGFCTYTEVLYTEKMYGYEASINYLRSQRRMKNDKPIIGEYGINEEGSGDMYCKGSWMLHTVRNFLDNDSLWFATLKEFHMYFELSNTNTEEVLKWFEIKLGNDVKNLMIRYLYQADIPVLQYEKKKFLWFKRVNYKWKAETQNFNLPIRVNDEIIKPTNEWQKIKLKNFKKLRKQFDWKFALYDIEQLSKED